MSVLVIGAGIGGLATALSLHQIGVPCRIFESVARIEPLGVGINTLPHAVRELTELGLEKDLERVAVATSALAYYTKRGQLIWSEPRGRNAGYRWPQYSIHRGELQMILYRAVLDRLGPECIQTGHHLADFEATNGGVRASFVDRSTERSLGSAEGELLLGADGIHSAVRRKLYPEEGPPIWNGAILWRGVSAAEPFLDGRTMIMAGHEFQKFVCYPISSAEHEGEGGGRSVLNWVAERKFPVDRQWRKEDWNRQGELEEFLPQFENWHFDWLDVPALIRSAEACYEYPMVDRDPLPRWTHGRVSLLGDAAHPMYPIGSNGASQAILDARVLARELKSHGATVAALEAYEAERNQATSRIVLANRGNGPEQVMQLVEERAPGGYDRIDAILDAQELEDIAANYKKLAGFDKEALNTRAPIVSP